MGVKDKSIEVFRFKQFSIQQDRCSMKVGTDGILLGAWADLKEKERILDVGTGTGLIAIMLAQRTEEQVLIDAVEIEERFGEQARENMMNSPWSDRLNCVSDSVQDYAKIADHKYDLIVSNPPFFTGGTFSHNQDRNSVRHTVKLPHGELLLSARNLLNKNGRLAVILPFLEGLRFQELATNYHLYCRRMTEVRPNPRKNIERLMMEFSLTPGALEKDELVIQTQTHNEWTDAYRKLTGAFYLYIDPPA